MSRRSGSHARSAFTTSAWSPARGGSTTATRFRFSAAVRPSSTRRVAASALAAMKLALLTPLRRAFARASSTAAAHTSMPITRETAEASVSPIVPAGSQRPGAAEGGRAAGAGRLRPGPGSAVWAA